MVNKADKTGDPLKDLRVDIFQKETFQAMDALVIFIPKGQERSDEVQRVLDEAGSRREFPQDNGYIIRCPNVVDSFDKTLFEVEKGGWEHEHCDTCGRTIDVGDPYWISEDEVYLICDSCYQKLQTEEKA
jgi:hypothetical protein